MTSAFRQTTATRSIPAMRPSYDGEHPFAPAPTPIYDELYSEYRRLFRALPGDRSGEEELRFTGFAVRPYDSYAGFPPPAPAEPYGALAQHQPFPGYPGQLPGIPQFVPPQGAHAHQPQPQHPHPHPQHSPGYPPAAQHAHQPQHPHAPHPQQAAAHQAHHPGHHPAQHPGAQQPAAGQGWVATGYLAPVTVPSPGRHRGNLLSLPPGRG
ncbi:hypothetical protein [Kitasatospora viridis]|uniref:hypothetical protein n=1 Tax=Kitasatospora viridis TaxID=281105 RepID=UPI0011A59436